ncbi:hypothetical protein D3218_15630 [Aureimonas flava]|uniref:Thermonuclease family protein n=1 Tax=Aureimonas flava TaxID=2320271 RepID=A0A3A1WHC1_9HYPH|nr:hypothetical protein [Aureimonas flava]RIX99199.1 hypothetical protein D3218_15630 [Aureimonas flava]
MQSLRIALGLLALVGLVFLILPSEPTLLAGRSAAPPSLAEAADGMPPTATAPRVEPPPAAPVRTIGPTPAPTTALTRLPPVASGAATPPRADEPEPEPAAGAAVAAATDTADDEAATSEAAAAPDPDKPAFRLFARPIAVDAGTLKAGEFTLRVAGVQPVARSARCTDGAQAWPCATRARTALRGWLRGRSVLCAVTPAEAQAIEITAPCLLGEEDVGDWVVRNGWARAASGSRYEAAESEAREARRGVWAYGFADEASASSGG